MSGAWKRFVDSVNTVLLEHWDPIGVRSTDPSWPRDEYESYVGGIIGVVQRGGSDHAIAEHLAALESGNMGVGPTPLEHRLDVARRVRAVIRECDDITGDEAQSH